MVSPFFSKNVMTFCSYGHHSHPLRRRSDPFSSIPSKFSRRKLRLLSGCNHLDGVTWGAPPLLVAPLFVFMPPPVISHQRHSVFCLSVSASVREHIPKVCERDILQTAPGNFTKFSS